MNTITTAGALQLVTFAVAGELFAAGINAVERILRFTPARPVPNAPDWLVGVIDYRDRVVPVINLRARFELESAPESSATRIVVFDVGGQWVGVVVDAVFEVSSVAREAVEPPPPLFRGLTRDYLIGLARHPRGVVIVINAERLFTSQERLVLEQAAGARYV